MTERSVPSPGPATDSPEPGSGAESPSPSDTEPSSAGVLPGGTGGPSGAGLASGNSPPAVGGEPPWGAVGARNPDWLPWVRELYSIAQSGLTYCRDPYDLERFEQLHQLTGQIAAWCAAVTVPAAQGIFAGETGYRTPKVDVRGVLFDEDRILLVREKSDGGWALPGGWADVGLTPSEAVVKEIREEAGLDAEPVRLLGVLDKRRHAHPPYPNDTYKIFIRCRVVGGAARGGLETSEVGWFPRDGLPPLSAQRNTAAQLVMMFAFLDDPAAPALFD
ncbi:putative MutT/nudix family protein [Frankia sp. AiPs1]|uniref:NUDIX hydrolase n=1 Tax=Frankia sp. AiPa1 TaxID=573492 RepID=UPI00202B7268|nr:NUDIX hydrolase [Frankia sp. AiPa1]MCL9761324.1 NUDIX hydrolase [Frankia sp. AiPa1]